MDIRGGNMEIDYYNPKEIYDYVEQDEMDAADQGFMIGYLGVTE